MKLSKYALGDVKTYHLRYNSPDGNIFLIVKAKGDTEENINLALLDRLENLSGEIEKTKIELQAPKNKCGSCKHFRYFNNPVKDEYQDKGRLVNGACIEGLGVALRDSQDSACASYDRKFSEGAVEEWEESF